MTTSHAQMRHNIIRARLKKRGSTQVWLAKQIGITPGKLSRYLALSHPVEHVFDATKRCNNNHRHVPDDRAAHGSLAT